MAYVENEFLSKIFKYKSIQNIIGKTCHKYCIEYADRIREMGKTYTEVKEVLEQDSCLVFMEIMKDFKDLEETYNLEARQIKYFNLYFERRLLVYVHRELDIHRSRDKDVTYKNHDVGISFDKERDEDSPYDPEFNLFVPDFTEEIEDREHELENKDNVAAIMSCVNSSYREIIELEFLQGLDPKIVCEILDIDDANRRQRKARAMKALKSTITVIDKAS